MQRLFIFLIAGWSGFLVMAVELLSGGILAPHFGNSIHVWGGVITVFMLALSIGYLLGGRGSLYTPSLMRLALIMVAAALALLPVMLLANPVLDWTFEQVHDPRYGSLAAASLLFFIPTAIAGMVSPYAVRLLVQDSHRSGHCAGLLYFVSPFGSAAGTILTSFYLVLYFEINQILAGLLAISLGLGLPALFMDTSRHAPQT